MTAVLRPMLYDHSKIREANRLLCIKRQIKVTPTIFYQISKMSDVCPIFEMYVLRLFTYFEVAQFFVFSFVSKNRGKTPIVYE